MVNLINMNSISNLDIIITIVSVIVLYLIITFIEYKAERKAEVIGNKKYGPFWKEIEEMLENKDFETYKKMSVKYQPGENKLVVSELGGESVDVKKFDVYGSIVFFAISDFGKLYFFQFPRSHNKEVPYSELCQQVMQVPEISSHYPKVNVILRYWRREELNQIYND